MKSREEEEKMNEEITRKLADCLAQLLQASVTARAWMHVIRPRDAFDRENLAIAKQEVRATAMKAEQVLAEWRIYTIEGTHEAP